MGNVLTDTDGPNRSALTVPQARERQQDVQDSAVFGPQTSLVVLGIAGLDDISLCREFV